MNKRIGTDSALSILVIVILAVLTFQPNQIKSSGEMKEARVSDVQFLKPGAYPAILLYLVDEAFDRMTFPVKALTGVGNG